MSVGVGVSVLREPVFVHSSCWVSLIPSGMVCMASDASREAGLAVNCPDVKLQCCVMVRLARDHQGVPVNVFSDL